VTLRGNPIHETATLPDGRVIEIRVGVPEDSYIRRRDLNTVTVELASDGEHLAAVTTVLDADQTGEARQLANEIKNGLESGTLEPTAGAIEPLAEELR
jgi:hypothetical protein